MEDILVFIINNLFPALIVIGILSSIFGRSRRRGGGNRMPNFGGGTGGGEWFPPGEPDGPYRYDEPPVAAETPSRPEVSHSPREYRPDDRGQVIIADARPHRASGTLPANRPAVSPPRAMAASYAPDLAAARSAEASRVAPALQVEQRSGRPIAGRDELRKAVLWAEILGPPRARKPHGRRFGR